MAWGSTCLTAATLTWTNTAGGNWNLAANWLPNAVPGAADTANITTPGSYTVTLNADATVAALNLGAGSGTQTLAMSANTLIPTAGAVNANGVLAMSGGSLSGKLTVQVGGQLTLATATAKSLQSLTLINLGTVAWSGGTLYGGNTPTTCWPMRTRSTFPKVRGRFRSSTFCYRTRTARPIHWPLDTGRGSATTWLTVHWHRPSD